MVLRIPEEHFRERVEEARRTMLLDDNDDYMNPSVMEGAIQTGNDKSGEPWLRLPDVVLREFERDTIQRLQAQGVLDKPLRQGQSPVTLAADIVGPTWIQDVRSQFFDDDHTPIWLVEDCLVSVVQSLLADSNEKHYKWHQHASKKKIQTQPPTHEPSGHPQQTVLPPVLSDDYRFHNEDAGPQHLPPIVSDDHYLHNDEHGPPEANSHDDDLVSRFASKDNVLEPDAGITLPGIEWDQNRAVPDFNAHAIPQQMAPIGPLPRSAMELGSSWPQSWIPNHNWFSPPLTTDYHEATADELDEIKRLQAQLEAEQAEEARLMSKKREAVDERRKEVAEVKTRNQTHQADLEQTRSKLRVHSKSRVSDRWDEE